VRRLAGNESRIREKNSATFRCELDESRCAAVSCWRAGRRCQWDNSIVILLFV
jgi:hypothetical protein